MLIYLEGNESFLANQAIRQIKDKYLAKNPDGVELIQIDADQETVNWADLQASPLFSQTRLIFIKRVGNLLASDQRILASYLSDIPASSIVVVWDNKPLNKKSPLVDPLSKPGVKRISALPLKGESLARHLSRRAKHHGVSLSPEQKSKITIDYGQDLWGMDTELAVMSLGGQQSASKERATEPFALYRAVQSGNWESAQKIILKDSKAGVPVELLIGSIASALRKTGKNPEKSSSAVEVLSDIDLGLKTGMLDSASAVALMAADLPKGRQKRVEWEQIWEESLGG